MWIAREFNILPTGELVSGWRGGYINFPIYPPLRLVQMGKAGFRTIDPEKNLVFIATNRSPFQCPTPFNFWGRDPKEESNPC